MRVDKSVIVLFRQMNLFLNRKLLDEKLTSSDVLYLALLYEQDGRTQDEMAEAYTVDRAATTRRSAPNLLYLQLAHCRAHWRDRTSQNKNRRQVQRISHTCRLFSPC